MSGHMNTPWTYSGDAGRIEGQHQNPKMGPVHIADMRGWGYLTGLTEGYALSLSEAEAMDVQRRRGELLAAAPDLLVAAKLALPALEAAREYLDEQGEFTIAINEARAAIARAEGGGEQ